eukprot:scaffold305982_cov21-Tisochrysis_lutea.AAC.1
MVCCAQQVETRSLAWCNEKQEPTPMCFKEVCHSGAWHFWFKPRRWEMDVSMYGSLSATTTQYACSNHHAESCSTRHADHTAMHAHSNAALVMHYCSQVHHGMLLYCHGHCVSCNSMESRLKPSAGEGLASPIFQRRLGKLPSLVLIVT